MQLNTKMFGDLIFVKLNGYECVKLIPTFNKWFFSKSANSFHVFFWYFDFVSA